MALGSSIMPCAPKGTVRTLNQGLELARGWMKANTFNLAKSEVLWVGITPVWEVEFQPMLVRLYSI